MLSHFSLTAIDSKETLHLTLGLVDMHSATACIGMVTTFSYSSFGVCF